MAVATSFSVKNVESAEFMTIISPAKHAGGDGRTARDVRCNSQPCSGTPTQSRCEISVEVAHLVPHSGIRIERQAANGNPGDKIARRGEQLFHQAVVFGEKQNIAHQAADGLRGGQLIDAVFRALLQKK